jgi:hypothetical protein
MKIFYRVFLFVYLFAFGLCAFGQVAPVTTLVARSDSLRKTLPIEKLYLQLDKPRYLQHDTIWFKGYLFNGDYLTPSTRSGILYIELDNDNNKLVKRIMVPVAHGLTWGQLALDENIPQGDYTLRAYTNWMRNFGEAYVFKKNIYIASANDQTHLITATFEEGKQESGDNIRAHILISSLDKKPARLINVNVKAMAGKHNLTKAALTTGIDGKLDINLTCRPIQKKKTWPLN